MRESLDPARAVIFGHRHAEHQQRGKEQHRVHQGAEQRTRHGDGHGPEHFALDALEREERDVDQHDDRHCKGDRTCDRPGNFAVGRVVGALCQLFPSQRRDGGFEHDDRSVDQKTKIDRAEAHQVTGHAEEVHTDHRDGHRSGDAQHHHQRSAQGAQKQPQHEGDHHRTLDEVFGHGGDRTSHEIGAVVHRFDLHTGGSVR